MRSNNVDGRVAFVSRHTFPSTTEGERLETLLERFWKRQYLRRYYIIRKVYIGEYMRLYAKIAKKFPFVAPAGLATYIIVFRQSCGRESAKNSGGR